MIHNNPFCNRRWIVLELLFAMHCSLFISAAEAQTFTQRIQKTAKGEGTVTIHQDKAIDALVNAPVAPAAAQPKKQAAPTPAKTTEKAVEKTTKTDKNAPTPADKHTATPATPLHSATATTDTQHDDAGASTTAPRRTRKITGYKVQAFAGGNTRADRHKAEQTANAIRSLFPGEQVESHFYNPRWLCRVGNYATYEEARQMLTELRRLGYSSATIVKGKITVAY